MYKDSLRSYIDDLAAKKPAPGGGSAAALSASLGVALISMVANFTLGKEKYKPVERDVEAILTTSETLRKKLLVLVDEEVYGYELVSGAYRLPKESDEQKQKRTQEIQKALKGAMSAPFEVCRASFEALKLTPELAEKGNSNLISDVGVAVSFLHSAFQSALLNVQINLDGIKDNDFLAKTKKMLEPWEEEVSLLSEEVWTSVKDKMKKV